MDVHCDLFNKMIFYTINEKLVRYV
jgi:hypothetical protein